MPESYGPDQRQVDVAALRAAVERDRQQPDGRVRWISLLGGVLAALGLAIVAGLVWSAISRPGPAAELAPTPAALMDPGADRAEWMDVLAELDARRNAAFAAGDAAQLDAVYAPGSPPLSADVARLVELRTAGLTPRGLAIEVVAVNVVEVTPGRVELAVRDRLAAYDLVDASGQVVEHRPARGEREWLVTVVPASTAGPADPYDWRISAIDPAALPRSAP